MGTLECCYANVAEDVELFGEEVEAKIYVRTGESVRMSPKAPPEYYDVDGEEWQRMTGRLTIENASLYRKVRTQ